MICRPAFNIGWESRNPSRSDVIEMAEFRIGLVGETTAASKALMSSYLIAGLDLDPLGNAVQSSMLNRSVGRSVR
jgi:hypothetical protein